MNKSTVVFFFIVVIVVVVIARCNSKSRLAAERNQPTLSSSLAPAATATAASSATPPPTPTPEPTGTPKADMATAAAAVQPAVVSISVFEPTGKLLRTGTGVFVSNNGRTLTSRSLLEGAAHAIVKSAGDKIYNVAGILADLAADDLAILNVEVKGHVPSIAPNTVASVDEGVPVAVIESPLGRPRGKIREESVRRKHKDSKGEWFELSSGVPADVIGAPVINGNGEVIGLVTRGPGDPAVVVRSSATLNALLARSPIEGQGKWLVQESPPSPAEGPLQKVPLAQNPQAKQSKLVYSPPPPYPNSAGMVRGTGKFRLTFDASGRVRNIMILKSTENGVLDRAAIDTLRRWKSAPGQEWELNVPITFQ